MGPMADTGCRSRPESISALEVIRTIDGPIILTECFTEHEHCDHSARCSVRSHCNEYMKGFCDF